MKIEVSWLCLLFCLFVERINSAPVVDSTNSAPGVNSSTEVQEYLARFGYMSSTQVGSASAIVDMETQTTRMKFQALMKFQAMAGINQTGIPDEKTIEMMNKPRCAVSDNDATNGTAARRRRRYARQGSIWYKKAFTYNINSFSQKISQTETRIIIPKALQFWASVTPLSFSESAARADINIRFAVRAHGDDSPFDGKNGVLAHAYYPQSGQVHIDDDESWSDVPYQGTNLLQVATHEFGHTLGLAHSKVQGAVMAPFYNGYLPNFRLQPDDIAGIQSIYGAGGQPAVAATTTTTMRAVAATTMTTRQQQVPVTITPTYRTTPDICNDAGIDAIVTIGSKTYAFKDEWYWTLDNSVLAAGSPQLIRNTWPEISGYIDTVFYLEPIVGQPGQLLFFIGDKYWKYDDFNRLSTSFAYPRLISAVFFNVPANLDAAFVYSEDKKVYFVKGNVVYRYTRNVGMDVGFPQYMSNLWPAIPTPIWTAFTWSNSRTYFFVNNQYYRVTKTKVDPDYPRSNAQWWFGCSSAHLSAADDQPGSLVDDLTNSEGNLNNGDSKDDMQQNSGGRSIPITFCFTIIISLILSLCSQ